jgi:predicted transcriptional regulator
MISSGYKWMSGFIDGGMRSGVPKNLHNNVATYYGKLNQYKNDLMLYNNKSCYLFLLDNTGHIKFLDEGASSTIKLNQLFMQIENL